MRIDVLTLFPEMFEGPLSQSILQRARGRGLIDIHLRQLRDFGLGNHRQVDDTPCGGGAGMVLRCDVIVPAIEAVVREGAGGERGRRGRRRVRGNKPWRIYLSPRGKRLTQTKVEQLSKEPWLLLLAGHYEGIDERVLEGGWIDEELSIGDYVLTGGELPAMVLIDAVARHIPGVLGKEESATEESFSKRIGRKREYPHYTKPEEFRGFMVPPVLRSGNHKAIERWRKEHLPP